MTYVSLWLNIRAVSGKQSVYEQLHPEYWVSPGHMLCSCSHLSPMCINSVITNRWMWLSISCDFYLNTWNWKDVPCQVIKVTSFFLTGGGRNFCFSSATFWSPFFSYFDESTGVTFGSSERLIHLNASRYSATAFDELAPVTLIFAQRCISSYCFINFMKCPQNHCDAITLTIVWFCEIKLVVCLKMSSVIKISENPGNRSYGIAISHLRCTIFFHTPLLLCG